MFYQGSSTSGNGRGQIPNPIYSDSDPVPKQTNVSKPLKCLACDLWCNSYEIWIAHLTSVGHQDQASRRSYHSHERWNEESLRFKCLIVSGVRGIGISQVVWYLSKWGSIQDFVFQQDRNNRTSGNSVEGYYVLYEDELSTNKILQAQSRAPHSIQGQQIFFRRKYERTLPPNNSHQGSYQHQQVRPVVGGGDRPALMNVHADVYNNVYPPLPPRPPSKSALSLVSSSYNDNSDTGLGVLQSTYGDDESDYDYDDQEDEIAVVKEEHDLFSVKMTEHVAKNLSKMKLEDQLEEFCKHIILSEPFLEARYKMIQELQKILQKQYVKCAIYPCGPDYIGIGSSDDEVIVFVDLFDNHLKPKKNPWEKSTTQFIPEIYKILKQEQEKTGFCSDLNKKTCTSSEDIQIITFTHSNSKVKCMLRTEGFQIVQESMLIKFLCTLDIRVRPLLILARYWSSFYKIFDGQDEMKNRVLILLMLFHLANRNVIPSLSFLQSLDHNIITINNFDVSFSSDTSKIPQNDIKMLIDDKSICTLSTLSLFRDFFERFAIANYKENSICLWPAKFVPKKDLEPGKEQNLPEDFAIKMRIGCDGNVMMKKISSKTETICIQDFFDMSKNIAEKIGTDELKRFQIKCWESSEKLEKMIDSSEQYLMDLFVCTKDVISKIPSEEIYDENEAASVDYTYSSSKNDLMNVEWEEFSRSMEKSHPNLKSNTSLRPIAPIAPSKKINPSFDSWYAPPVQSQQLYSQTNLVGLPPLSRQALLAKPPMRYESERGAGPSTASVTPMSLNRGEDPYSMNVDYESNLSSSDESNSSDSDSEEEQVEVQSAPGLIRRSSVKMATIKLPRNTKNLFLKAVHGEDFLYGIQGKMQALYLMFMKDFTHKFWTTCLGFDLDLDPPHQDINIAKYAHFDFSRMQTLSTRMDGVPVFEDSRVINFYCRSRTFMNRILNSRENDFINGKFLRRQINPSLCLMTEENPTANLFGQINPVNSMRFRCSVSIKLDYEDLNQDCTPRASISFEDVGSNGGIGWIRLRFLGRLFTKMAPRFILFCYKKWLTSCCDFDLISTEKILAREKCEENRRNNLLRKGQGSSSGRKTKKQIRRLEKLQKRQQLLRTNQQVHQSNRNAPSTLSSSRQFQVPPNWNRSMDIGGTQQHKSVRRF